MDAKVDDFFNEINEIAPPKLTGDQPIWKKCYDELTGYPYYWNVKTDQVTWETPAGYNPSRENEIENMVPPRKPEFSCLHGVSIRPKIPEESIKIYSIKEENSKVQKKSYRKNHDSDDEKIILISSYGGDTESEAEDEPEIKKTKTGDYNSENEDDMDILTKIQKRAKELKTLGSELPLEVTKCTDLPKSKEKSTAVSLVAGYSDSEEENDEVKTIFSQKPQTSYSTLFPIAPKIDIKDFEPKCEENKMENESEINSKAFVRKKRIGVSLINVGKKGDNPEDPDQERRGLGFNKSSESSQTYPNLTKGGIMFVKSDVLNPKQEEEVIINTDKKTETEVNKQELEDTYNTLREKLEFLNEGRSEVPPTQIMVIQVQTLYSAMSAGDLKPSYLQNWLQETYSKLVKLEKEATPEGWLLQWDRSHKRYYYQNVKTGASQWEYPQPDGDADTCDDAMDISTTPPPENRISPPLPPMIRCPTPPPPPIISQPEFKTSNLTDVPLPPDPPSTKTVTNGEPLPPGVDLNDVTKNKQNVEDSLITALDTFYSEVAAIESPSSPQPQPPVDEYKNLDNGADQSLDGVKKKKKKVKLTPGLTLKKRGVSELVEKWKNVQQQFNKN